MRIAIVNNKQAYWVHDNTFWEADVVRGEVDHESAHPLDTEALSDEQMKDLFNILDNLKE